MSDEDDAFQFETKIERGNDTDDRDTFEGRVSAETIGELDEKANAPELPDGAEARDERITASEAVLDYLEDHHYATRGYAIVLLLWRTALSE